MSSEEEAEAYVRRGIAREIAAYLDKEGAADLASLRGHRRPDVLHRVSSLQRLLGRLRQLRPRLHHGRPYPRLHQNGAPMSDTGHPHTAFRLRIPRLLHKVYAAVFGYFWLPCPTCGEFFGGHEGGGLIADPSNGPGRFVSTCRACSKASTICVTLPLPIGEANPLAAQAVAGMCHWVQNRGGCAERDTHEQFHFGYSCPYEAMAAVLRGEPDPRDEPV